MDTYDRIMLSLKEQVGKGKRFESAADLAFHGSNNVRESQGRM